MTCHIKAVHGFLCQFQGGKDFHFAGYDWCLFHLPLQDDKGNRSPKMTAKDGWNKDGTEIVAFTAGVQQRLNKTMVTKPADLRGFVFPPQFDFRDFFVVDKHHVNFSLSTFGENVDFSGVSFGDNADFSGANFTSGGNFHKANFGASANFRNAIFKYFPNFEEATFGFIADFSHSTFVNAANFSKAEFHGYANFSADAEFRDINFSGAMFKRHCLFNNRAFVTGSSFNGAVFKDLVEFHGCKFHQGLSFHGTRFLKTKGEKRGTQKDIDEATERLERSYRTLKLGMEGLRARNEEAMFFALEMECRRQRSDVPKFERLVAAPIYRVLSNYGQNVLRPLVLLIALTIFSFLFYRDFGAIPGAPFRNQTEVFRFTLEQTFKPFTILSTQMEDGKNDCTEATGRKFVQCYPRTIPLLASLQSLATLSLLALFLLALRRRFKMD